MIALYHIHRTILTREKWTINFLIKLKVKFKSSSKHEIYMNFCITESRKIKNLLNLQYFLTQSMGCFVYLNMSYSTYTLY